MNYRWPTGPAAGMDSPGRKFFAALRPLWFGLAYLGCALASDYFSLEPNQEITFWMPSGLCVATLLLSEGRQWPGLVLAALSAHLAFDLLTGRAWSTGLLLGVGYCLEAVAGAWLVRRFTVRYPTLHTLKEVVGFLVCAALASTLMNAFWSAGVLRLGPGSAGFWANCARAWNQDAVGVLVAAPVILTWAPRAPSMWRLNRPAKLVEAGLLVGGLVFCTSFVFGLGWKGAPALMFTMMPFVVWAALQFGPRGAAVVGLILSLSATWIVAHNFAIYGTAGLISVSEAILIQLFFGVAICCGLIPAAILGERREAEERWHAKQMAEALSANEARLKEAQRIAHLGSWEHDLAANKLYWSDEIYRIFEVDQNRFGASYEALLATFHPEDRSRVDQIYAESIKQKTPFEISHRLQCPDGSVKWVHARGETYYDDAGRPLRSVGTVQDITERKRMEESMRQKDEALRQAQKMEAIGQLAGGVAHDFNNILAAILMQITLLKSNRNLTPEIKVTYEELEREARRAVSLTRQLLTFGRRQVMQVKSLDLNEVLSNLFKMLRRLLDERIELIFSGTTTPVWIEADAGMIEQVVTNLCVNARDAMPQGGQLTISTTLINLDEEAANTKSEMRPGRFACLSIADTGCGMEAATLKRIFEPFFTTKKEGQGMGLGLATAYAIVKQHHGWIEIDSTVGQGSTFRVYLPALIDLAPPESTPAAVEMRSGTETVLLVEDEASVRKATAAYLRLNGYHVLEAANGVQALQLWQQERSQIDLLLTDMVMPAGMTGLELAKRLRQDKRDLPIIICTGYQAGANPADLASQGVLCWPKPCEPADLAILLRQCLDKK